MSRTRSRLKGTPREQEMRALLATCEESDQSKAAFALRRKLQPETFAWWASEIRRRDAARREKALGGAAAETTPSFVDVVVRRSELKALFFEIELGDGRRVSVPAGLSANDLARLLAVVNGGC